MAVEESKETKGLIKQYEKLVSHRRSFEPQWREIASYVFPRRINSLEMRSPGQDQTELLFDSTAIFANEVLSAAIQSGMTNQAMRWFDLRLRDEELNEDDEVAGWLEENTTRMLLAFRQSNLNSELHELYLDLGAFGVGAMLIEESPKNKGLLFRTIPVGEFVVDEDETGQVDTLYYEFHYSARSAAQRWGEDALSEDSRKLLATDPYRDLVFIHAIYPRTNRTKFGSRRLPWASVFIEKEKKHKIAEGGYNEFPATVPRWAKASGEVYGRSPGHTALPDIKTLNKAVELELRALSKVIDPPMKATRNSIIGKVKLGPGSLTLLRDIDGLKELITNPRFDISQIEKADLRQSIKNMFFVDQMLQLMSRDKPQMTATEVQVKVQLLQQILGPTSGRLQSELYNQLIDRTFALMFRGGKFTRPPAQIRNQQIDVQYEGPLARAQRAQQLLAIERTLTNLQAMLPLAPDVVDNVNMDETFRESADISGAPAKIIRTTDEVAQIRETRAKKQAEQEAAMKLQTTAEAAGKAAPAVKALVDIQAQGQGMGQ